MSSGNTYNLNDPDLSYFITNTQLDREIQNVRIIYTLNDMQYDLNYEDKESSRYNTIKYLIQHQLESGLNTVQCVFLPSIPDELVDQSKLIVLENVDEKPTLSEQIVAIVDTLLEYQCNTKNQHQTIVSALK